MSMSDGSEGGDFIGDLSMQAGSEDLSSSVSVSSEAGASRDMTMTMMEAGQDGNADAAGASSDAELGSSGSQSQVMDDQEAFCDAVDNDQDDVRCDHSVDDDVTARVTDHQKEDTTKGIDDEIETVGVNSVNVHQNKKEGSTQTHASNDNEASDDDADGEISAHTHASSTSSNGSIVMSDKKLLLSPTMLSKAADADGTTSDKIDVENQQDMIQKNEPNADEVTSANELSAIKVEESKKDVSSFKDRFLGNVDIEQAVGLSSNDEDSSENDEHDGTSSEYHSCSSTMMAHGGLTTYSGGSNKYPTPKLNETMDTSSDEESGSSDNNRATNKKKAAAAGQKSRQPFVMTNHRRNVIAAGVVSVALIVLVGLGLGLSRKGNNEVDTSSEAALSAPSVQTTEGSDGHNVSGSSDDGQLLVWADLDLKEATEDPTRLPTTEPTRLSTTTPSVTSSTSPSSMPLTPTSTPSLSTKPTTSPSLRPSLRPSLHPSLRPTSTPSSHPTTSSDPTAVPTSSPSTSILPTLHPTITPTSQPSKLFLPGDLTIIDSKLDIRMSSGLSVKLIAETDRRLKYANGQESSEYYHAMMDGAGIMPLPEGGYVYVSNSEISNKEGGVYGLYFDDDGNVVNYKTLLSNTNRNCGGGITPWATWVSCEEKTGGQCWQVDPDPNSINHGTPMETVLGGEGGRYETVACDNTNPNQPIFFTTEDHEFGALRRFEANGNGWDSLHSEGTTTFLRILSGSTYEWTTDESSARNSAAMYYRNSEGVTYHEGKLYFAAKKTHTLFILDLQNMTYEAEYTGALFSGQGSFNAQPDQLFLGNKKRWVYFTEDGGTSPGVYVRDASGTYHTIFEAIEGGRYGGGGGADNDETVGIALSPDRRKLYAGFQDAGVLMEFTREDGLPFE